MDFRFFHLCGALLSELSGDGELGLILGCRRCLIGTLSNMDAINNLYTAPPSLRSVLMSIS